jgi:hypothetical protein
LLLLDKTDYNKVAVPLGDVSINNLFARAVVERKVDGSVYVDDASRPSVFHIVHPYGMSLLLGNMHNVRFNSAFREYALNTRKTRNGLEWMQAFPDEWRTVLGELFSDCMITSSDNTDNKTKGIVELNTRVNFKFDREKYKRLATTKLAPDCTMVRTDKKIFNEMKGNVIPSRFWNSADDFAHNGIGFSVICKGALASTAFSAFVHDRKLELGIETIDEFRHSGFAVNACVALIDYCVEHDYEPVWACRLENVGSYNLACRLGFDAALEIPFYRLSE